MEVDAQDVIDSLRQQLSDAHYKIAMLTAQVSKAARDGSHNPG